MIHSLKDLKVSIQDKLTFSYNTEKYISLLKKYVLI